MVSNAKLLLLVALGLLATSSQVVITDDDGSPPSPELNELTTIPLPPSIEDYTVGACSETVNPRKTGCIVSKKGLQIGSFTTDGDHVLVQVTYIGAPEAPGSGSVYSGQQVIVVKTDGGNFSNAVAWRCITCGVPSENAQGVNAVFDYPQAFKDGKRALIGTSIIDCGDKNLSSESCRPEDTHIYPIRWNVNEDGSGAGGAMRELRIHTDNVHLGFSPFTLNGMEVGQLSYYARLEFNPSPKTGEPLYHKFYESDGGQLKINRDAIAVGELRGFSGDGTELTYVGTSFESSNLDVFAIHLQTGAIRRLTSHPDYCDPMNIPPDSKWMVILDTRAAKRMMWAAAMRNIPPILEPVTLLITSGARNNDERRFFQPFLLDREGDRGEYYGQQINTQGDGIPGNGNYNDPEWNAQADPKWSPDGTRIVYYQIQTTSSECGGENPLPCYNSTEPYGRRQRVIVARLSNRTPYKPLAVSTAPDTSPWDQLYVTGVDSGWILPLDGSEGGHADVTVASDDSGWVNEISVSYFSFTDDGNTFLNGSESAVRSQNGQVTEITWFSDLEQNGAVKATKKSSPEGLTAWSILFIITGWTGNFTTTVGDESYSIPLGGT